MREWPLLAGVEVMRVRLVGLLLFAVTLNVALIVAVVAIVIRLFG